VRVSGAGVDRKATGTAVTGSVTAAKIVGNLGKVSVALDGAGAGLVVGNVARVWEVQ
jgi:hypothetical protein